MHAAYKYCKLGPFVRNQLTAAYICLFLLIGEREELCTFAEQIESFGSDDSKDYFNMQLVNTFATFSSVLALLLYKFRLDLTNHNLLRHRLVLDLVLPEFSSCRCCRRLFISAEGSVCSVFPLAQVPHRVGRFFCNECINRLRFVTEELGIVLYEGLHYKHSIPRDRNHIQRNLEDMLRLRLQTWVWQKDMTEDEREMRMWATCKADFTYHTTENGVRYWHYRSLRTIKKRWEAHKRAQRTSLLPLPIQK